MDQKPEDGAIAPEAAPLKDVDHTPIAAIPDTGNSPEWRGGIARHSVIRCIAPALFALFFVGCGATEATRRVNVNDRLAAQWIADRSQDAGVDEAALLIVGGSHVLEAEIGSPEVAPTTYDPKVAGEDLQKAKDEIAAKAGFIDRIFGVLETTGGKISALLGLGTLGAMAVGWFRTALWSGKLWHFAQAAGAVIEQSKELKAQVTEKGLAAGATAAIQKVVDALPTQTPKPPAAEAVDPDKKI